MEENTESTINDRLKFLLEILDIKPGRFSRELGMSETTVRNYIDRKSKPSSDVLEKIVKTYSQVNLVWLVTGLGSPIGSPVDYELNPEKNRDNIREAKQSKATLRQIFEIDHGHELQKSRREIDLLRAQIETLSILVATKDALIAAKDETLTLLRESLKGKA